MSYTQSVKNDEQLLSKYQINLVGSILQKDNPRDVDILCVLPDKDFKKIFQLSAKRFIREGKTGKWSPERCVWAKRTVAICHLLANRLKGNNIDFKFVPQSFMKDVLDAEKTLSKMKGYRKWRK